MRHWVPILTFLLALGLRLLHLDFGLPAIEEEAFPLKKAFEMWGWESGAKLTLDPETAGWPALSFYIHLLLQKAHYGVGLASGAFSNPYDYFVRWQVDPTPMVLLARVPSAIVGAAVAGIGAAIGQRLAGRAAALAAGLLLALSPLLVEYGQLISPDILLVGASALALLFLLRFQSEGEPRFLYLAAVAVGLGAAFKYTPVLLCPVLWLAVVQRRQGEGLSLRWAGLGDRRLGIAALLCLLSFGLPNLALFDADLLARDLGYQALHLSEGHFGHQGRGIGFWAYFRQSLPAALGWPGLLLGLVGLAELARRGAAGRLLLASFLVFYLGLGGLHTNFDRYMLPALLPLALGAGWLLAQIGPARSSGRKALWALATMAILFGPASQSFEFLQRQGQQSTQLLAESWVESNLESESRLLLENYGPELGGGAAERWSDRPEWAYLNPEQQVQLQALPRWKIQHLPMYSTRTELTGFYYELRALGMYSQIITSGAVRRRYEEEAERFPEQVRFYRELDALAPQLARFRNQDGSRGPEIVIYGFGPEIVDAIEKERGKLDPDWWKSAAGKTHRPHFLAFAENSALLAKAAGLHGIEAGWLAALVANSEGALQRQFRHRRAAAWLRSGEDAAARSELLILLRENPRDPVALGNLGVLAEEAGEFEAAIQYYEDCARYADDETQAGWARARLENLKNR